MPIALYTAESLMRPSMVAALADAAITAIPSGGEVDPRLLLTDSSVWALDADLAAQMQEPLKMLTPSWTKEHAFIATKSAADLLTIAGLRLAPFAIIPDDADVPWTHSAFAAALALQTERLERRRAQHELVARSQELSELNEVGLALSSERDYNRLVELILTKVRGLTLADAGTLYLLETHDGQQKLRFRYSQNDSIPVKYAEILMPLSPKSIAGYVVLSGRALNIDDVYELPADLPCQFNRSFDQSTGYRTRSLLAVPMRNHQGEIIGVLQLINRKRTAAARLTSPDVTAVEVVPFDERGIELTHSLASQAAVAIENSHLYESIYKLFEGFVQASVTAIESRDPTTSGHSTRVSVMTVGLAEVVDRVDAGRFREVHFTREQIREVRYASLLHDFGKVGVREDVLLKAKKLYPGKLDLIAARFAFIRRTMQLEHSQAKLEYAIAHSREEYLAHAVQIDAEYAQQLADIDRELQVIIRVNEPTVLPEDQYAVILSIAERSWRDLEGKEAPLLLPEEVKALSIKRGSLDDLERREIESHVSHTFRFLSQIPWTKDMRMIPDIAHGHHERLDGSGYPQGLRAEQIPVQSKIMSVADIFDALAAKDRPYKKAVPVDKALDILRMEVRDSHLDHDLLELFIEARVFEQGLAFRD